MAESIFRIFPENSHDQENPLPREKSKTFQPFKGTQKKALGDVKNTLQTHTQAEEKSGFQVVKDKDHQIASPSKSLKKDLTLKQTNHTSLNPVILKGGDGICAVCNNPQPDLYEDIRPLSERLDCKEIETMIRGIFCPSPYPFRSPPPTPSPPGIINDFDFEDSYEVELLPLVEIPDFIDSEDSDDSPSSPVFPAVLISHPLIDHSSSP